MNDILNDLILLTSINDPIFGPKYLHSVNDPFNNIKLHCLPS